MSLESRINSLIGAYAGGRVYAVTAPDGVAAPFAVWQRIVSTPVTTHDAEQYLNETVIQVACYAETFTAALGLRTDVIAALVGNHAEGPISLSSKRDTYEDAVSLYRCDADFSAWDGN
jgi:hypothetical protein